MGEERGSLGRAADLLVRHHLLDLDQGAGGRAPQETVGVARSHELHVAVRVGLGRVEQGQVRLDGGHGEERLAAHRVGEDLEVRIDLWIGGAHAAAGGHERQHLSRGLETGIVLPLVALPHLDLPALGRRPVEGADRGQRLGADVGADHLAHAPRPDEQIHVEAAHRRAHHGQVTEYHAG